MPCFSHTLARLSAKLNKGALKLIAVVGLFAAHAILASSLAVAQDKSASWTDNTGKRTIEAEMLSFDGKEVVLLKKDGKTVNVPLAKLNKESQEQAKRLSKANKPAAGGTGNSNAKKDKLGANVGAQVDFPADCDAKTFVDIIQRELKANNPVVLWDALPERKQQDVEAVVQKFAKKVDSRTFDLVRRTRDRAIEILKTKKEFIIGNSVFPIPEQERAQVETSYNDMVALAEAYLSKDLMDPKRLQKGDLRGLLSSYLKNLAEKTDALANTFPPDHPLNKAVRSGSFDIELTVEQSGSSDAKLTMSGPGQPTNAFDITYKEGRWQIVEMVKNWESSMAKADQSIASINGEQVHGALTQGMALTVAPILGNLKNAKTQAEFDAVLASLKEMASQLPIPMGGGMGPPGGPGGFGPPPGQGGFGPPPGAAPPPSNGLNGGQSQPGSGAGTLSADQ